MIYYSFFPSILTSPLLSFPFFITCKWLKGTSESPLPIFQIFIEDSQINWSWFTYLYHALFLFKTNTYYLVVNLLNKVKVNLWLWLFLPTFFEVFWTITNAWENQFRRESKLVHRFESFNPWSVLVLHLGLRQDAYGRSMAGLRAPCHG